MVDLCSSAHWQRVGKWQNLLRRMWRETHHYSKRYETHPNIRKFIFYLAKRPLAMGCSWSFITDIDIMYSIQTKKIHKYVFSLFILSFECRCWQPSENKQQIYQNIFSKLWWVRKERKKAFRMLKKRCVIEGFQAYEDFKKWLHNRRRDCQFVQALNLIVQHIFKCIPSASTKTSLRQWHKKFFLLLHFSKCVQR